SSLLSLAFFFLLLLLSVVSLCFLYFLFSHTTFLPSSLFFLLLAVTTLFLVLIAGKYSKASAWLLFPYLLWSAFATYLSFTFYTMHASSHTLHPLQGFFNDPYLSLLLISYPTSRTPLSTSFFFLHTINI
ncbi:tryptophan-rich sensory protein, partial [Bacillus velezensis]|uniref:tryptophan-rich sensory protein n=1 Tax=Bacillus velezensis TaxID=492670 RepID=UPI001897A3A9